MKTIESLSNIKIKELLKLKNNKKYRKKERKFIIQGVRIVFEAIKQNAEIKKIFITKKCENKIKNTPYDLSKFKDKKLDIYRISENISKKISCVETSQGIFGVVENFTPFKKDRIQKNSLILALFKINDPGNLGTLFRSAYSFGFEQIVLYGCCDIYNEKVIRSSMGSIFNLSFLECLDTKTFVEILTLEEVESFAATVSKNSKNSSFLQNKKGILVLGNEANGLPRFIVSNCNHEIKIQIKNNFESLNVSCAGSILMYEMNRDNLNLV